MKRCICTIICSNYIAYARSQYGSLKGRGVECDYRVFIVDAEGSVQYDREEFEVVVPDQLFALDEYRKYAFLYNALELSTNVKPRFIKYLLQRGYHQVLYLDPDISVYGDISPLFGEFLRGDILLTPHALSPHQGELRPNDQDFLAGGVFNLGFIGVSNTANASKFLDWWEQRCLQLGYNDVRSGLMVDQKWVNLAPCYFDGVAILKDPGYNVAYWNLHERHLSIRNGIWYVNDVYPLLFFHFSGIRFDNERHISRHQNRFHLEDREDIAPLLMEYRSQLLRHDIERTFFLPYRYDQFDNGMTITDLARKVYGVSVDAVQEDPFSSAGHFFRWLRRHRMVGSAKKHESYNSMNYNPDDPRLQVLHAILRITLLLAGPAVYHLLMKYLSHISIIRNQASIFQYRGPTR